MATKEQKAKWEEEGRCRECGDWPIDSYEGICYDCQMKSAEHSASALD